MILNNCFLPQEEVVKIKPGLLFLWLLKHLTFFHLATFLLNDLVQMILHNGSQIAQPTALLLLFPFLMLKVHLDSAVVMLLL
jgi:hypothetical protein